MTSNISQPTFEDFLQVLPSQTEPGLVILDSSEQISAVTQTLAKGQWQELTPETWSDKLASGSKLFLIYHQHLFLPWRSLLLQFATGHVQINQNLETQVFNLTPSTQLLVLITVADYQQLLADDPNLVASFGPAYRYGS